MQAAIVRGMMITDGCHAHDSPAPDFRSDSGLCVEFTFAAQEGMGTPVETPVEMPVETREKILRIIAENPTISMEEMITFPGITRKGVEWQTRQLREEGVLGRVGPAKGGHWKILK